MKRIQMKGLRLGWILMGALFLSSCGGFSGSLMTRSANRQRNQTTEEGIFMLVNRERSRRGLQEVRFDAGLQELAARHARVLASSIDPTRGKPSHREAHQGFDARSRRARALGYLVLAEVVMIGYAGDLNAVPERSLRGWLGSPGHRSAILHKDRRLMGVASRILPDGRYFVVGLLSNRRIR